MSSPSRITRLFYSLAVAGGLAFGTQTAFAFGTEKSDGACPYDPPNGWFGLSCTAGPAGDSYCNQWCTTNVPGSTSGFCDLRAGQCCVCDV